MGFGVQATLGRQQTNPALGVLVFGGARCFSTTWTLPFNRITKPSDFKPQNVCPSRLTLGAPGKPPLCLREPQSHRTRARGGKAGQRLEVAQPLAVPRLRFYRIRDGGKPPSPEARIRGGNLDALCTLKGAGRETFAGFAPC